jgi:hypothetical protein
MKDGKDLISRGASTTRTPAMTAVIFANLRGTVRIIVRIVGWNLLWMVPNGAPELWRSLCRSRTRLGL